MGIVLRYVNKHEYVIERFLAIVHVSDTSTISLKKAIDELFAKHKFSLSRLRGQGYDGALNMRGEYNGLKALILKENSSARYAHCFAHQLQLVVVAVAKSNQIVLDMMVQEMSNRFSESSTEVLTCIACLDPKDSFSQFDIGKLLHLVELYPEAFSLTDRVILEDQLETYIQNVRGEFSMIEDLGSLAKKMVETGKNTIFPLVYRLIELVLVLPVITASVERVFSAMKIPKTDLRNRMGNEWMNDSLVVYIEKNIFATIENEQILQHFQQMNTRRIQLPLLVCMSRSNAGGSSIKK
ncbi:uncharacterized protein LOC121995407 [Zingiber officinale]|uniref:uncharacterized protein LOC121995407 n=1 Tax=Zingiber officinale TaxID=94328 RepID=UPI001C4B97F2|nr:uncharacterized protein LOC121995407 [Zingiber officinale]